MKAKTRWTLLVYMAGDNDLDRYGVENLSQMLSVGSGSDVRVVVQFDRSRARTGRYVIPDRRGGSILQSRIAVLPDVNTGDPKVLSEFILWGRKTYPSDRLGLVIWAHGDGWKPYRPDSRAVRGKAPDQAEHHVRSLFRHPSEGSARLRFIGSDYGSRPEDAMDTLELKRALFRGLRPKSRLDLLVFDACHMSQLEVGYQVRDFADIMMGSEEEMPFQSLPYKAVMTALRRNPSVGPEEFAREVARGFLDNPPIRPTKKAGFTQSVLRLISLKDLAEAVSHLGAVLARSIDKRTKEVHAIVAGVQRYLTYSFADIGDFAALAASLVRLSEVKDAAREVRRTLRAVVSFQGAVGTSVEESTGLSIYLPPNHRWYDAYRHSYAKLDFNKDYPGWLAFLDAYHSSRTRLLRGTKRSGS